MSTQQESRAETYGPKMGYTREQLVTLADLDQFRNDLLKEMKSLLNQKQSAPQKSWLKSFEVRKLLKISSGTLQHLRDVGKLPFTRVGGIIYYEREDIEKMLEKR